ncbi:MAG TPA: tripartite tricarboxylate transporter TctB family protein [Xanthobacteraceae bacterium]|nr:tripartite tricarboxylate transporter TctB family protein [Xanthobacteraceae bacterium]
MTVAGATAVDLGVLDRIPMRSDFETPSGVGTGAGQSLLRAVSARRGGICVAGALAATGLLFAWQASLIDFGDFALPGPGFFPLALAVSVVLLSVVIGVEDWLGAGHQGTIELGHRDVLIVLAALLAVPPLFEPLGAYLTLGLFGATLLVLIARCSLLVAGLSAIIAMVACWYFFQVALGLQLPIGAILDGLGM